MINYLNDIESKIVLTYFNLQNYEEGLSDIVRMYLCNTDIKTYIISPKEDVQDIDLNYGFEFKNDPNFNSRNILVDLIKFKLNNRIHIIVEDFLVNLNDPCLSKRICKKHFIYKGKVCSFITNVDDIEIKDTLFKSETPNRLFCFGIKNNYNFCESSIDKETNDFLEQIEFIILACCDNDTYLYITK